MPQNRSPKQRMIQLKMSAVLKLRNPYVKLRIVCGHDSSHEEIANLHQQKKSRDKEKERTLMVLNILDLVPPEHGSIYTVSLVLSLSSFNNIQFCVEFLSLAPQLLRKIYKFCSRCCIRLELGR